MTRRVTQAGQDNWHARSGYQRSPRVPGPIQGMDRPKGELSLFEGTLLVAGAFGLLTLIAAVLP